MRRDIIDNINKTIMKARNNHHISTKDISDGCHTFAELYAHRIVLFCIICNTYPEISWKSKKHYNELDDPMYEGCFIAGIKTPLGDASYHIKLDYWDEFEIQEIENAPKYDGHKSMDDLVRLKSLSRKNSYKK